MTSTFAVSFTQAFGKDISGFYVDMSFAVTVEFTTPDISGDDYENAAIAITYFSRWSNGSQDLFAHLKPESEIPEFYAKVRELARREYIARRMQIQ